MQNFITSDITSESSLHHLKKVGKILSVIVCILNHKKNHHSYEYCVHWCSSPPETPYACISLTFGIVYDPCLSFPFKFGIGLLSTITYSGWPSIDFITGAYFQKRIILKHFFRILAVEWAAQHVPLLISLRQR